MTKTSIRAAIDAADLEVVARSGNFEFTRAELRAAFDSVANSQNWKLPIAGGFRTATDPTRSARQVACMREAVIFFTGSVPEIKHLGNYGFSIKAAGYYAAVGA